MKLEVCARLRASRKAAKLTQAELAEKVGITSTAYSGYERGTREPSIELLSRIAKALDIPISVLSEAPGEETETDKLCAEVRKRVDLHPIIQRLLSASPSAVEAADRLLKMLA